MAVIERGRRLPLRLIGAILGLYSARGAMLSFLYLLLPAILSASGLPIAAVTLSSLVFLPVGLTWLWAPIIDRTSTGRSSRQPWLVGVLLAAAILFILISRFEPSADVIGALVIGATIAALAGTIGTTTDAVIVDQLSDQHRAWANACQAAGVAVGGLVIAGLAYLLARFGWSGGALAMAFGAAILALMALVSGWGRSLGGEASRATENSRIGLFSLETCRLLLLMAVSRAGVHLPMGVLAAFQVAAGLSLPTVAFLGGAGGAIAGLAGAAAGGLLATRLSSGRALFVALLLLGLSSSVLALCVRILGPTPALAVGITFHVFVLTAPVFIAMHRSFMAVARPGHHAADMARLTGAEFCLGMVLAALSGTIVQHIGFAGLFALAALSAFAAMALAHFRAERG